MGKYSYIKEKAKSFDAEKYITKYMSVAFCFVSKYRKAIGFCLLSVIMLPLLMLPFRHKNIGKTEADLGLFQFSNMPMAVSASQKSVISIPSGVVKSNPFLPYRDISGTAKVNDIPSFNLVEPPEVINENSEAARVMDTVVSGILYDKYSPSAILNIEGNDYLVKKGDVVNNYKVLNILKDSVTVKLGANVYQAGIGEILTEGTINYNDASNLKNKFGGGK